MTIAGIDIGGTKVRATALGPDGETLATVRNPTGTGGHDAVIASTTEALDRLLTETGTTTFDAIGVGIAGLVDAGRGTVAHAVNLGIGADPLPIVSRLEAVYGVPVHVENDVNVGALGAHRLLRDDDVQDLAYLALGTGIAAGIVLDGRLHRGRRGVAGEIGHFPIDPDGPRCECGLTGCLEAVASGRAIAAQWPHESDRHASEALFAAAERGDPAARELVATLGESLAKGVLLLALTYDVDLVVVGGGVSNLGAPLYDAIDRGLGRFEDRSSLVRSLELRGRVRPSPDQPVGAIGAAVHAIERTTGSEG